MELPKLFTQLWNYFIDIIDDVLLAIHHMFKISEYYEIEDFCRLLTGSTYMPDKWIESLSTQIRSSVFTKKLGDNETETDRQTVITKLWEALRQSDNKLLISTFVEDALSSKKTGDELAYRILFYLAKNEIEIYQDMTNAEYGTNLYSASVLRAINNYYKYGIHKALDYHDDADDLRYKLQLLIMN